ncbi:hypothetical protein GO495_20685 [Chitinophaga oryziterrae]|uniref:Universal stress protein n=1 Tax=Chitinophaga oryziterrae TaxID=1031224 RepID=A0A6N8JF69_9BACT|nr:universal stress protein [Chitinophaga oryziterrae]MVT43026.1 hypothetical protein [Chitinophaga oryziterrae]
MEKILFVTDAIKLNTKMLDFAAFICNLSKSKLTGVFLENQENELRPADMIAQSAAMCGTSITDDISVVKEHCCKDNIEQFQEACARRGIDCTVHRDRGNPVQEIITESRYADLLLLDVETSFLPEQEPIPTSLVKDVLADAECPVIILPVTFEGIEQLVFTLDGQPSSIFAIKQFTYLFPQLNEQRTVVVSINEEETIPEAEERYKLKEWLHMHYKNIEFVSSPGNVRIGLLELVLQRSKAFIVMGAYGRNKLSNFLHPSHADPVLRTTNQPVFIAHH